MKWILSLVCMTFMMSCGNTTRSVVYNDQTYSSLQNQRDVRVKSIEGHVKKFYKMTVTKVDEKYIYAQCWRTEKSEPENLKFTKAEVVIETVHFSGDKTINYGFAFVLLLGIILVTSRIFR